jgi:hypothetical protein
LIIPLAWARLNSNWWWMQLRCPECGACGDWLMPRSVVEVFEQAVEFHLQAMEVAADRWRHRRMIDWGAAFVLALASDAVWPSDF